jgi:hypothetical protein
MGTLGKKLADAVAIAKTQSPVDAYAALYGTGPGEGTLRIDQLGPSYGTKVLYFAAYDQLQGAGEVPPLILDSNVATALHWLGCANWPSPGWDNWSTTQYADYLDIAASWARQWNTQPDVIERVLFDIGKSQRLAIQALT